MGNDVSLFAELNPTINDRPALAFDSIRGGFWRAADPGLEFFAVENGQLSGTSEYLTLDFSPFSYQGVWRRIVRLVHLPEHQLLGTVLTGGFGLFTVDQVSGEGGLLASWDDPRPVGAPAVLGALSSPPSIHEQLVPIVGGGAGENDTYWTTELWLYNPSDEPQVVELRRVTAPDAAVSLSLPGHGSIVIPDALTWIGGGDAGDGTRHEGLVVTSEARWGEELVVAGRISTPAPGGGRYGHAVPAVPGRVGYSNHTQYDADDPELRNVQSPGLQASHLDLDYREPGRYRYNVGIVNDLDEPVTLTLAWGYSEPIEKWTPVERPPESEQELTVEAHDVVLKDLELLFPQWLSRGRRGWPSSVAGRRRCGCRSSTT